MTLVFIIPIEILGLYPVFFSYFVIHSDFGEDPRKKS